MTAPPAAPTAVTARWRARAFAVLAGVLAAAAIWVVSVPVLGHRLVVAGQPGEPPLEVGLVPVIILALVPSLAGWGLLAILERRTRTARRAWTTVALVVLAISFLPLTGPGTPGLTKAVLAFMHLAVAAVLIPTLTRTSPPSRP